MSRVIEYRVIEQFKERKAFSRKELQSFFQYFEPNLKEGTLAWRIYSLKKKNILRTVKRGWYAISSKPRYIPSISAEISNLNKLITQHFQNHRYCIWETSWLNEFLHHQSNKQMVLVEIERGFEENLFYQLKDSLVRDLYLNPSTKEIDLYITESEKPVVIKKLITRSPVSQVTFEKQEISTPTLEKILVDLFSDQGLFYIYGGTELIFLFESAFERYPINFTRLFSYAKRRDRNEELETFLNQHLKHLSVNYQE